MIKVISFIIFILFTSQFFVFAQEQPPIFNPSNINSSISPKPPVINPTTPPPPPETSATSTFQTQNFLKNIQNAIESAKKVLSYSKCGKIWIHTAPMGEKEIKAGIIYNNVIVGVIKFSTLNGEILPEGYNEKAFQVNVNINSIYAKFQQIKKYLKVVNGVEFREPELCFAIPVIYNGKIVFKIKIYYDGVHVIPDYSAMGEIK